MPASAQAPLDTGINAVGETIALGTADVRVTVARIINVALALLGIVGVGVVLYGGFLWMTSKGEEDRILTAKRLLLNGGIGLAIVLSAFGITQFVLSRLLEATRDQRVTTADSSFALEDVGLTGALGAGPIVSHFPARDAEGVPPNTRIFVTFRERVRPVSLAENTNGNQTIGTSGTNTAASPNEYDNARDLAKPEAIQVATVGTNVDWTRLTTAVKASDRAAYDREAAKLTPVGVSITADLRTIVLTPVETEVVGGALRVRSDTAGTSAARASLAGNAREPVAYLVRLTNAIARIDTSGDGTPLPLFTGAFRDGYAWPFTVSSDADRTPPTITSVIPFPDPPSGTSGPASPRNAIVQVNFSEAVDPTVTTGEYNGTATPPFLGVTQTDGTTSVPVDGAFTISNAYRTVEFITAEACGVNSCGGTMYCLPGNATFRASADAAVLDAGGPAGLPFSGIMDAAGNSLDGNGDTVAQGPGASRFNLGAPSTGGGDSVAWSFRTNDTVDLVAPRIADIVHYDQYHTPIAFGSDVEGASLTEPFEVLFTKLMAGATANAIRLEEVTGDLTGCVTESGAGCIWHAGGLQHEDANRDTRPDQSRAIIAHGRLRDVAEAQSIPEYRVRASSEATDIFQNCFFETVDPRGPRGPTGGETCVVTGAVEECR